MSLPLQYKRTFTVRNGRNSIKKIVFYNDVVFTFRVRELEIECDIINRCYFIHTGKSAFRVRFRPDWKTIISFLWLIYTKWKGQWVRRKPNVVFTLTDGEYQIKNLQSHWNRVTTSLRLIHSESETCLWCLSFILWSFLLVLWSLSLSLSHSLSVTVLLRWGTAAGTTPRTHRQTSRRSCGDRTRRRRRCPGCTPPSPAAPLTPAGTWTHSASRCQSAHTETVKIQFKNVQIAFVVSNWSILRLSHNEVRI